MKRILAGLSLAAVILGLFLALEFARPAAAQLAAAGDPPLNFGNNFFVTGDYVVAGATGLNASFGGDGFGTATISFPDGNPGIHGATTVPKGATILAALLYWETVEKTSVMPGQPGSGQNGFFRPKFQGGPTKGYPISGVNLPSHSATSFSNGGCSGISSGKLVRAYRADVRGFLPLDADGNTLVDKADGVTFEVRLPNVGNNTPLTLGATLVLVYRVISPNFPLNVITIYDGAFAPNATPNFTMSQPVQGFYQAGLTGPAGQIQNPISKLTHIVGAGKSNKFQQAFLSGGQNGSQRAATPLPSLYGNGQPAFVSFYTNWDNPTWIFPDPQFPNLVNPLQANDDSATATVVASGANPGCVSWGATIVSTTVYDPNKDGILPVWKNNINPGPGYTDVGTGQFVSLADPINPPSTSQQDVYVQMDHMVDVDANGNPVANGDFTPDLSAVNLVKGAFANHNIHLHITDAFKTTGIFGADSIKEKMCTDNPNASPPFYCSYPNQPGIVGWRYGFEFIKNQPVNYPNEAQCESAVNPPCVRRFPIAQRNSHHYVVFGDTLGAANWTFFGGTLTNAQGATPAVVSQVNSAVTFYTSKGHGLMKDDGTHSQANARVTVFNAITNANLTGTFFVTDVKCPPNPDPSGNACDVTNTAAGPYSFTINIPGNPVTANYSRNTDPYLAVASGQAGAGSGLSDVGGMGTLVTLGRWRAKGDETLSAKAGTLMHEMGHTLGLNLHGGSYFDKLAPGQNIPDYRQAIEANCKSNYQSVMNYMFQTRLLGSSGVVDFSSQQLSPLDENNLGNITTNDPLNPLLPIAFPSTDWYDTQQTLAFKGATITSFVINSGVVTFQAANTFSAGNMVKITGLSSISGMDLNGQVLTVISAGLTNTQFEANVAHANASANDSGTAVTTTKVGIGQAATHHCDDTPLNSNDPPTYFYQGGTILPFHLNQLIIPWSNTKLDANFEGGLAGSEPPFRGYNDWANVDLRQTGATGNSLLGPGGLLDGQDSQFAGPGQFFLGPGPGGFFPGPGGLFPGPGGLWGGPGAFFPGPGGLFPGPGGLWGGPGALWGGPGELDLRNALSVPPASTNLSASEGVSARTITLTWSEPNFPATTQNNIYRDSHDGKGFVFLTSVAGAAPGTQVQFQDNVTCNPNGYSYFVTIVVQNFAGQNQEGTPSNIVSAGQNGQPLTGCYSNSGPATQGSLTTFTTFSFPNQNFQGEKIPITWSLQDDDTGVFVNATTAPNNYLNVNTLNVFGPFPNNQGCPAAIPAGAQPISLLSSGIATPPSTFGISNNNPNQFQFMWDTSPTVNGQPDGPPVFSAGCYFFTLKVDSVTQSQTTSALQLQIDVTDSDTSPHITTTSLPNGVVGTSYSATISEDGGVTGGPHLFAWALANGLTSPPPGLSVVTAPDGVSGLLSGIPSAAGVFSFKVQVTDSVGNIGTQALTTTVTTPVAQINQPLVPDSSAPGAPACTPTCTLTLNGTGFGPFSQVLWNGSQRITTFINNRQLTATIPASDVMTLGTVSVSVSNPMTVGSNAVNNAVPKSNIDFFQITPATSASLSRTLPDDPTGASPLGLIAADFNGDGRLDLAIANSADNTVTILLGNGDGTFTAQPNLSTGASSTPQLPIAGDFNGDGKLDLAVANFGNGTVSVFLANGDGTFQTPATYAVGNGPGSLVTGDFNRDGSLDLAVANQNDATVSILLGKGDGTFKAHVDYAAVPAAAATKDAAGIAVGDFNGDGELDLVVANPSNNTASVLLGNGNGSFQAPVPYTTGNHPINFGVADLSGDGILDLAVANFNDRTVSILVGNGNGTFKAQVPYSTTGGAVNGPTAVATGDFNGDGKVDLAITNSGDNSVSILLGNGDGTLQAPLEFTTGNTAAGVAAGDFNGDGRLDVAVADFSANTVSIMLQRPEPASNLAVSGAPTASQVKLTWTASPSASTSPNINYNIYRSVTSGSGYAKVNLVPVAATTFTDMSVAAGTTYFYVVTAVDQHNLESVNSNEVTATTPPQAPQNLTGTEQGTPPAAESVLLNWAASTNAASYNVYRSTMSGGPYGSPIGSVNAATTFTDTTVVSGTTYYYVVTAVGPANAESLFSNQVTVPIP